MTPSREESLFAAALERPPSERAVFLDGACLGDAALRARVEALLLSYDATANPLVTQLEAVGSPVPGLSFAEDDRVGQKLGRYKLLEKLGEGGCGVVYVAEQTEPVRRRVALKVIKLGMDTKQVVARFEAERQALALMDHPNIAKVLDAGTTDAGRPFFVMELVRGIRITDYCDQAQLGTKERLDLFIKVCQAIQHAHQKGIIHRDIKPSNILVTLHDGVPVPKVIDFGIAKATEGRLTEATVYTQLNQFIGTPAYMSPEQAEMSGLDIDTRSDIYSLGVLLYELLTGRTPFDAKELMSLGLDAMRKTIRERDPARPSTKLATLGGDELTTTAKRRATETAKLVSQLKGDLDWIVMKCLEKDRTRRYETANGLASDITRHLTNEPVVARPPSAAYKLQKAFRRNRLVYGAGALVFAALALGVVLSAWQAVRAEREARKASQAEQLARQRLEESEAISKFMTEVFQSPDPAKDGRTITVAETLGAAAKKLEKDLASQPERRAQLQLTLGKTYYGLGLFREAIELQRTAVDVLQSRFGVSSTNALVARVELTESLIRLDTESLEINAPVAEEIYGKCRAAFGPDAPATLRAMAALATVRQGEGRRDEARQMTEELLDRRRRVLGVEHSSTLQTMRELASFLIEFGRTNDAARLSEEVVRVSKKRNGEDHPETLRALSQHSVILASCDRIDLSMHVNEELLPRMRRILGEDHYDTLMVMINLSADYRGQGRFEDAIRVSSAALETSGRIHGKRSRSALVSLMNLAHAYSLTGRTNEAIVKGEAALDLSREIHGIQHPRTLECAVILGEVYRLAGQPKRSIELLEAAVRIARPQLPGASQVLCELLRSLADSCEAAGRSQDASSARTEMAEIMARAAAPIP